MQKQFKDFIINKNPQLSDHLRLSKTDDYSLTVNDFSVLFIPTLQHLENLQLLDNQEQANEKFIILKHSDLNFDYQSNN